MRRLKEVLGTANRKRLLRDDGEVKLLRRLQDSVRLFDAARGKFVRLSDALRPGEKLYEADLVCIGEQHDSEADHTIQRIILDAIQTKLIHEHSDDGATAAGATDPVAVGVEYFYREQNDVLDALVFGEANPKVFQERSQFGKVWNYDWSLYKPLFRYVQLSKNRLVGLNIPKRMVREVAEYGIDNVAFKDALPQLDLSVEQHRHRFENMMGGMHQHTVPVSANGMDSSGVAGISSDAGPDPVMDRFYTSQCLWEEYMSQSANGYLQANAGRMVLLAGLNHVWRDAIPDRFERQSRKKGNKPMKAASVVPWHSPDTDPARLPRDADYIICMHGGGGVDHVAPVSWTNYKVAAAVSKQRARLRTQERVFPAGFV
jgi:uncharacterized iron-regulated protein